MRFFKRGIFMGIISNFEGQSQIRNLLNNEDYDKEKVD